MSYFKHLILNWIVVLKCACLAVFHLIHGVIPVKYTSHEWLFDKKKLAESKKQIEELKCCGNCLYFISDDCKCKGAEQYHQEPEPEDVCGCWEFWQ